MSTVHAGAALAAGLSLTDLDMEQLWLRYFGLGGRLTRGELAAYLGGVGECSSTEHDLAAQVLNEDTSDHGMDHPVSYSDEV